MFLIIREIFQKFLRNTVDIPNDLVVLLHRRFTFKGVLTAKQPKGCDAKLQGLPRRQAEWQPVATLRRIAPRGWINFYEKERDVCALCNPSILFSDIDPRNLPGSNPKNKKKVKYKTMKKKPLLFALLALAIVTSLTAGTLAVYTKSVSLAGDVQVKKFAFDAKGGNGTEVTAVKLAPKESQTTNFEVTNTEDGKTPAEVNLDYVITVDIAKTAAIMVGLTAELLDNTGKTVANGVNFTYSSKLAADTIEVDKYQVKLTWNNADNARQTRVGSAALTNVDGLKITVAATQDTSAAQSASN